jgi:addiction module HigA family antidote
MPIYKAVRNKNRCPSHPGAVIGDILQDIYKPKTEIAGLLGISRQHLYDILSQKKPLSPSIAARVAKAFGGSPESWLRRLHMMHGMRNERSMSAKSRH